MQQLLSVGRAPEPAQLSTIIALVISSLALILSIISLYLQRRDRKPRLKIRLEHLLLEQKTRGRGPASRKANSCL